MGGSLNVSWVTTHLLGCCVADFSRFSKRPMHLLGSSIQHSVGSGQKCVASFFWASSLLCLIRKGMSIPWSTKVHATDASHWGRGVVSGDREVADIRVIGGVCDRWRFSRESESLIAGMPDPVQEGEGETDGSFSLATPRAEQETLGFSGEVPLDFIGTGWQKVDSAPWSRDEPTAVLEGRVLVWLGQHLARSTKKP